MGRIMHRIGIFCAALAFAFLASPLAAQQTPAQPPPPRRSSGHAASSPPAPPPPRQPSRRGVTPPRCASPASRVLAALRNPRSAGQRRRPFLGPPLEDRQRHRAFAQHFMECLDVEL